MGWTKKPFSTHLPSVHRWRLNVCLYLISVFTFTLLFCWNLSTFLVCKVKSLVQNSQLQWSLGYFKVVSSNLNDFFFLLWKHKNNQKNFTNNYESNGFILYLVLFTDSWKSSKKTKWQMQMTMMVRQMTNTAISLGISEKRINIKKEIG